MLKWLQTSTDSLPSDKLLRLTSPAMHYLRKSGHWLRVLPRPF